MYRVCRYIYPYIHTYILCIYTYIHKFNIYILYSDCEYRLTPQPDLGFNSNINNGRFHKPIRTISGQCSDLESGQCIYNNILGCLKRMVE